MRYIKDIRNSEYKIGLYQWNGKYIIKIEAGGMYEQVYKVDETEITSIEEIEMMLDQGFLQTISQRFEKMHLDIQASMIRNGIIF